MAPVELIHALKCQLIEEKCGNWILEVRQKDWGKEIVKLVEEKHRDQKKIVELKETMNKKNGRIMDLERAIWEHRTVTARENSKIQEEIQKMAWEKNLETRDLEHRNKELMNSLEKLKRQRAEQDAKAFNEKPIETKTEVQHLNTEKKETDQSLQAQLAEKDARIATLETENGLFTAVNATVLRMLFAYLTNNNGQLDNVPADGQGAVQGPAETE